jgi:hypothetical protein
MSIVDTLKMHADLAVYGQQVVTVGLSDLRALLALVRACEAWESALTSDGSVMVGEPELRAALRAVTQGGA